MYYYDGTDRTEVYSGTGGVIAFTDGDKKVTQIVLSIPSGTTINTTVYPQLELGTTSTEYEMYKGNKLSIDVPINGSRTSYRNISDLPADNLYPSDTLLPKGEIYPSVLLYPNTNVYPVKETNIYISVSGGEIYLFIDNVSTYLGAGNLWNGYCLCFARCKYRNDLLYQCFKWCFLWRCLYRR